MVKELLLHEIEYLIDFGFAGLRSARRDFALIGAFILAVVLVVVESQSVKFQLVLVFFIQ